MALLFPRPPGFGEGSVERHPLPTASAPRAVRVRLGPRRSRGARSPPPAGRPCVARALQRAALRSLSPRPRPPRADGGARRRLELRSSHWICGSHDVSPRGPSLFSLPGIFFFPPGTLAFSLFAAPCPGAHPRPRSGPALCALRSGRAEPAGTPHLAREGGRRGGTRGNPAATPRARCTATKMESLDSLRGLL